MRLWLDGSVIRPPLSGVQLAVRNQLLALLADPGLSESVVLCRDDPVSAAARGAGVAVRQPPRSTQRVAARIAWQQVALPHLLRHGGADGLHAFAYTAPLRCPVPYLLNVHDIIALESPDLCSRLNAWHMKALLPPSIRRAAGVVVSSCHVAERIRAVLDVPRDRLHVVPLGVDADRFATPLPASKLPADLQPGGYLLFVGNLEPKKGLPTLLRAYASCAHRLDRDLVLAGRAAWKSAPILEETRRHAGPGRVRLLGRVPGDILPALYQHAWAFAFPSVTEGFGLPILEAMAAGTPVVHSDSPVVAETAGDSGLAFRTGDADDLARQLVRLSDSQDLRGEILIKGRGRARSLPWSRWGRQVTAVWEQTLG